MKRGIYLMMIGIVIFTGCGKHKETPLADGVLSPSLYSESLIGGDIYVLDNFTDGITNYTVFDDSTQNPAGNSTGSFVLKEEEGNKYLHFEYYLGPDCPWRYVGVKKVNINMDVSAYSGISIKIRGSGSKLRINLNTAGVTDWDYHGYVITNTPLNWQLYIIKFSEFKRTGFGTGENQYLDLTQLREIEFKADSGIAGEYGWFDIDDIKFVEKIVSRD